MGAPSKAYLYFKLPRSSADISNAAESRESSYPPQSRDEEVMILKQAYLLEYQKVAICVQRFDDSRNSAIHITYRISLRSSSLREPRDPLSKVVSIFIDTSVKLNVV